MIGKLFKKDKKEKLSEREEGIKNFTTIMEKWNLEDLLSYVRGQKEGQELNDFGLASILIRFNTKMSDDKKAPNGKRREFECFDRHERTKKGLDLFMSIAASKALSTDSLGYLKEFSTVYHDVIIDLDKKLSQTYESKIKQAYTNATLQAMAKAKIEQSINISNSF